MRRTLSFGVLLLAALFACDEDPIGPDLAQGWIGIEVIVEHPSSLVAAMEPSAIPSPAAVEVSSGTREREFLADTFDVANTSESSPGGTIGVQAPVQAPAASPAQPQDWESISVSIYEGDTQRWTGGGQPGTELVTPQLDTGAYVVVLKGLIGGEVDYFGVNSNVLVRGGDTVTATITFRDFKATPNAFTSPTTDVRIPVTFTAAPAGADGYLVDLDSDPGFSDPTTNNISGTNTEFVVSDSGTYYVRVRAY